MVKERGEGVSKGRGERDCKGGGRGW